MSQSPESPQMTSENPVRVSQKEEEEIRKNQTINLVGTTPGKSSGNSNRAVPPSIRHNAFKLWAWQKVYEKGEDCIIGYSGKTGTGKTTLSCKHAEDFDIEPTTGKKRFPYKQIKGGKEILVPRLVNSITAYRALKAERRFPTGTVTILDEAQVLLNSRDFMSSKNREMIKLFSTGRVYKHFTFVNLPHWQHLDNQIKSYLHAVVICHRPNKRKGLSYYTPYLVEPMGYGKPPLTKLFRFRTPDGRLRRMDICEDTLPSNELMLAQEEKVNAWKEMVRLGQVTSSGDKISSDSLLTIQEQKQQAMLSKAESLVKEWYPNKQDFMSGGKYVVSRIKAMGLLKGQTLSLDAASVIALRFQQLDEQQT